MRQRLKRMFTSLQSKYMVLILTALILFQFVYLLSAVVIANIADRQPENTPDYGQVERTWHESASVVGPSEEQIARVYQQWSERYPEAAMFWVNGEGQLQSSWNIERELPQLWSAAYTIQYMKSSYGNDPYTVVAFVGGDEQHGFIVLELPRTVFNSYIQNIYDQFGYWIMASVAITVLIFIILSYMFFRSIRKRLLRLQGAMSIRDRDQLPIAIDIRKKDEIGQLEQAFNQMVLELKQSKAREQEEEQLRRQLIANLSHDIRTPLTKLRANAYTIRKHELPAEIQNSATALESSVRQIDELVDNLLAYTLLIGERYRIEPKDTAMLRFLREHAAAWYAAFEQEGFTVDMKLQSMKVQNWRIDPVWMKRVLDNLLQNVLRHASTGKYVAIETASCDGYDAIRIIDQGPGMALSLKRISDKDTDEQRVMRSSVAVPVGEQFSEIRVRAQGDADQVGGSREQLSRLDNQAGSGIGLSIVDMMIKGMGLTWHMYARDAYFIVEIRRPHEQ